MSEERRRHDQLSKLCRDAMARLRKTMHFRAGYSERPQDETELNITLTDGTVKVASDDHIVLLCKADMSQYPPRGRSVNERRAIMKDSVI
ncbi:hypothetical protein ANO11243_067260 [Dothideomycetidae sp. 11243]|nr:hypothetical protein ANO11243_067260 [fungal sp. No.11243]